MKDSSIWSSVVHQMPTPAPDVSLHIIEDSGLIFDRRRQCLYAANTCATYIWCCLEDGLSPIEIVRRLERRFSFEQEKAKQHFASVIADWRSKGLATTGDEETATFTPSKAADGISLLPTVGTGRSAPPPDAAVLTGSYDLLDTRFQLDFCDRELFRITHPLIAHLSARQPPQNQTRLSLTREETRFALYLDGSEYFSCTALNEVPPMVIASLGHIALHRSSAKYALHAGAARLGERCILLSGASGVGKSTLIATLAAEGFEMLADDTVVIEAGRHEIRPVRLGLCLKPGSWPYLWRYYPELTKLPIYHRTDGKIVRYVTSSDNGKERNDGDLHRVDLFLFPRYLPQADTTLTRLDTSTALVRLSQSLYLLDRSLDEEAIERLIDWVADAPCYDLRYSSIADAIDAIRNLGK